MPQRWVVKDGGDGACGNQLPLEVMYVNMTTFSPSLLALSCSRCCLQPRHTTGSTATSPSRYECLREAIDRVVADLTSLATESDRLTSDIEDMDEAYVSSTAAQLAAL